jgi:DNA invertase Pin-like site-specific DNA recombinase
MSQEQSWRLILTEMGIDTRTPMGKAMAHMAVVFAELTSEKAVVVPGANP